MEKHRYIHTPVENPRWKVEIIVEIYVRKKSAYMAQATAPLSEHTTWDSEGDKAAYQRPERRGTGFTWAGGNDLSVPGAAVPYRNGLEGVGPLFRQTGAASCLGLLSPPVRGRGTREKGIVKK